MQQHDKKNRHINGYHSLFFTDRCKQNVRSTLQLVDGFISLYFYRLFHVPDASFLSSNETKNTGLLQFTLRLLNTFSFNTI